MEYDLELYTKELNFEKSLAKLQDKLKNKKVLVYGAGKLFKWLYYKYDLSCLNIVGISDYRFNENSNIEYFYDYPVIKYESICDVDVDYILVAIIDYKKIINNFKNKKFKNKNINIMPILPKPLGSMEKYIKPESNLSKEDEFAKELKQIKNKLAMPDSIFQMKNVYFYLPFYPVDFIQAHIVDTESFFEEEHLESLEQYIPQDAVIFDIGANIGNHSIYWGKVSSKMVKKIYSFEPVKSTFDILEKNIELNNLKNKVSLYNYGLGDREISASELNYTRTNIGATSLIEGSGEIKIKPLDEFNLGLEKLDFMKIDVEEMELKMLKGGINTLKKYKPLIYIESQPYNFREVRIFLESIGYKLIKKYPASNWLFQAKN